ncbi:MAG: hypothetical protein R3Y54_10980, partial [Eubacteriales bacterium]
KKLEELSYVVYMNEDEETIRTHALLTEDNQYYIEEELYNKSFQILLKQKERIFNELEISKEYRDSIEKVAYNKYDDSSYRATYYLEKEDVNIQTLQDVFPNIDFSNGADMQLRSTSFNSDEKYLNIYFYVKDKENTRLNMQQIYTFE